MNQEMMEKNLEANRYRSSSITANLMSIGLANSSLENLVKNALAKEDSASFLMALGNGGIYQNNSFFGSSGLYNLFGKVMPKKVRESSSKSFFNIGKYNVNFFSQKDLNPVEHTRLGSISKNISENNPTWNVNTDIISTGIGVQKKGYKQIFNQLEDEGFELNHSYDKNVELNAKQNQILDDIKSVEGLSTPEKPVRYNKTLVGEDYRKVYANKDNLDKYVGEKILKPYSEQAKDTQNKINDIKKKERQILREQKEIKTRRQNNYGINSDSSNVNSRASMNSGNSTGSGRNKTIHQRKYNNRYGSGRNSKYNNQNAKTNAFVDEDQINKATSARKADDIKFKQNKDELKRLKKERQTLNKNKKEMFDDVMKKKMDIESEFNDFQKIFKAEKGSWNAANLSKDMQSHLGKRINKLAGTNVNIQDLDDITKIQGFIDDFIELEKKVSTVGSVKSSFGKMYTEQIEKSTKRIQSYATKHGVSVEKATKILAKENKEEMLKFVKTQLPKSIKEFSDDFGRIFASKTLFQKAIGNPFTKFLSGVKSSGGLLLQIPAMVLSGVAAINQENAIQNFVSSYFYNPDHKEVYNNQATYKSIGISSNIRESNMSDYYNIMNKRNTAERYLNDLDPINIDLDYTSKSFDLNPRNE